MNRNAHRLAWLSVVLAGCAPGAARVAPTPPPVAQPPDATCAALADPRRQLDDLLGADALTARRGHRPRHPEAFAARLDATAKQVHAVVTSDDATAKLVAETGDLFTALAGRARALAAADVTKREEDVQAATLALYVTMEGGRTVLHDLGERCERSKPVVVAGRLAPVVIQKIIRASFDSFRQCYEDGLRRNPKLEGHVRIHFTIGRDGTTNTVYDSDQGPPEPQEWVSSSPTPASVMPDTQVSACVVAMFRKLSFPPPDGGVVTVTYPIVFAPGG